MGEMANQIKKEHEYISLRLEILKNIFMKSKPAFIINIKDLRECIRFHAVYTSMCHNGKEDAIIFKNLQGKGIDVFYREINRLSMEHELCNDLIYELNESLKTWDRSENPYELLSPDFMMCTFDYINHVESHIKNEDNVLLPILEHFFSFSEQEKMCELLNKYENTILEKPENKDMIKNVDYLLRKYS